MEWQTRDDLCLSNQNLKNTLSKRKSYRIEATKQNIKLGQNLSETTLCMDIPCYLLDLWTRYFRDSSCSLIEIFTVIKDHKLNKTPFTSDSALLIDATGALINRLNEYAEYFEKYKKSTMLFANRDEKIKRSPLKNQPDLRFIPVNLHLEQFQVESCFDGSVAREASYDFTSVGAFTCAHVTKPPNNSIELLMASENLNKHQSHVITHDVTLIFYTLKVFISILNDLSVIYKTDDKIQPILRCSKNLETVSRCIIPSFEDLKLNKLDPTRNLTRESFIGKFKIMRIKFEELNEKVKQTEFQNLDDFIFRITEPLVELFNFLFAETISEKIMFINNCASFCQSMTTLIASLDLKYYNNSNVGDKDLEELYKFHVKNGILFQVESMLSCSSTEADMMYDHYAAIQGLNKVQVHFPQQFSGFQSGNEICILLRSDGYHVYFYSSFEAATKGLRIYPLLFNVGINEQAFSSNFLGNNLLQKYINSNSIINLRKYYDTVRNDLKDMEVKNKLDTMVKRMETNKGFVDDSRPVELLHLVAEVVRFLGGIRVTNCKSGKDRTGVSISLEQVFILSRDHNLDYSLTQYMLDDIRRNGTRIDVVKKNVGVGVYAFNKIRYFLLPHLYQPPADLCGDYET